jgi:1-acyl-sn-glycerol-3-phosphate acyltransferase
VTAGSRFPRWGGSLTRGIGRLILRLKGWRAVGEVPDLPNMVIPVAPHSSNWDFVLGIAYVMSKNVRVRYIGKRELFRWPLGPIMRWLGGIPVDRAQPQGVIDQVVAEIRRAPGTVLGITPEGTRKRGAPWKSGFYRIAVQAGIPIVPGFLDWSRKEVGLLARFHPTGEQEADLAHLRHLYAGFTRADGFATISDPATSPAS